MLLTYHLLCRHAAADMALIAIRRLFDSAFARVYASMPLIARERHCIDDAALL